MAVILAVCVLMGMLGGSWQLPAYGPEDYKDILQILAAKYYPQNYATNEQNLMDYNKEDLENNYLSEDDPDLANIDDACNGHLEVVDDWPSVDLNLGQIGGIAICKQGHPTVFHRADRSWEADSFLPNKTYAKVSNGPIEEPVLIKLNKSDGTVLKQWGDNLFYFPHGLSVDNEGNYWMTDVAMHQVFKFTEDSTEPKLILGKAFEPALSNSDNERFCQPTDVAVASNGDIYVADGYCASRIVKFNKDGAFQAIIGEGRFWIPHSLALAEDLGLLCVADRENMTISCIDLEGKGNDIAFSDKNLGRIFALSYVPKEGRLYVVTGQTGDLDPEGLTIDLAEKDNCQADLLGTWSPYDQGFDQPHDVAASPDGDAVYVGEIGPNNIWKFIKV